VRRILVSLGDVHKRSARLKHAKDLAHIADEVGSIVLRLDRRHEIELVCAERHVRNGGLLDPRTACPDEVSQLLKKPVAYKHSFAFNSIHDFKTATK